MAVRNISAIDNAPGAIKMHQKAEVESVRAKMCVYRETILDKAQDIKDVIDTFNYCVSKGLKDKLDKYCGYARTHSFIIKDNRLVFKFNEWRSENSGPYNWYVETDGDVVYVRVNEDEISDIDTMIDNALYKADKICGDKVIAPIFHDWNGKQVYTCHSAEKPLAALKDCCERLPIFISEFFTAIDNLGKTA